MSGLRHVRPGVMILAAVLVAVAVVTVVMVRSSPRPTQAQRAQQIASTLHCPVCADLSAADSPAPLARQMRQRISQQLAAGATPDQIRQRFVAAYGPSVLMTPPDQGWGRAANLAPILLLAAAIALGGVVTRRGLRTVEEQP